MLDIFKKKKLEKLKDVDDVMMKDVMAYFYVCILYILEYLLI